MVKFHVYAPCVGTSPKGDHMFKSNIKFNWIILAMYAVTGVAVYYAVKFHGYDGVWARVLSYALLGMCLLFLVMMVVSVNITRWANNRNRKHQQRERLEDTSRPQPQVHYARDGRESRFFQSSEEGPYPEEVSMEAFLESQP